MNMIWVLVVITVVSGGNTVYLHDFGNNKEACRQAAQFIEKHKRYEWSVHSYCFERKQ